MEGFLIFALVVCVIVVFFRYLRKREMEAFRQEDMGALQSFNAEREKAGQDPLVVPDEALVARAAQLVSVPEDKLEVEPRDGLFDEIHRHFFFELERAVDKQFTIFAHVPMNAIVRCDPQLQNRLLQKSMSFVVCHPASLTIIAGIQLKVAGSDAKPDYDLKTRIFEQIGLPLITFPMIGGISATEILDQLGPLLIEQDIGCPECGGGMALRRVARGKNAGQTFKVCRRYPACKGRLLMS